MKRLLIFLAPALLSAQVYVVDAGTVEINKKVYVDAKLTYTLDVPVKMIGFSIKKMEALKDKAVKLRVDYKENGQNKTQNFLGKMPKVKKVKAEKVSAVPIAEKEKETKK